MTNLATRSESEFPKKNAVTQAIKTGVRVRDMNDRDLDVLLATLLQKTALSLGYSNTFVDKPGDTSGSARLKLVVDDVSSAVKQRFKGITSEELKLVFQRGRTGGYGEFKGLNPPVVMSWIREYYYVSRAAELKKGVVNEEKKPEIIDFSQKMIKEICASKYGGVPMKDILKPVYFEFLQKKRLIPAGLGVAPDVYAKIINKVKARIMANQSMTLRERRNRVANKDRFLVECKNECKSYAVDEFLAKFNGEEDELIEKLSNNDE